MFRKLMNKIIEKKPSEILKNALEHRYARSDEECPEPGRNHYMCNCIDNMYLEGDISEADSLKVKSIIKEAIKGHATLMGYFGSIGHYDVERERFIEFYEDLIQILIKKGM